MLRVGGLARLSSVDWPGELAATVFAQGCPWDCAYCHNPHLIPDQAPPDAPSAPSWTEVLEFLRTRVGLLDGVIFSGGEPLAQNALPVAVADVRTLGLRAGLHTNGAIPARLAEILPDLTWVGLDVKAPRSCYERVTGRVDSGEKAFTSLQLLVADGIDMEVRTTVHPALLGEKELLRLAEELRDAGVRTWVLQPFRPDGARSDRVAPSPSAGISDALASRLAEGFASFSIRA